MSGPENDAPKSTSKKAAAEVPAPEPKVEPAQDDSPSQAAQATAAASAALSDVRERLVAGEQFLLAAAGGIVLIYVIWQFLLNYRVISSDFTVVLAVLTVLAIWIHRWGHYDFGKPYRIIVGALGVSLALFALMNLLAWARVGGGSVDFIHLIGRLLFWACGVAAFVGAWQVFRTRED